MGLPFKIEKKKGFFTIKEINYGTKKCTEIGFIGKRRNNHFGRNKKDHYNKWEETEIYNKYTKSYYYRDNKKNANQQKEKGISKQIEKLYPKKYLKKRIYEKNNVIQRNLYHQRLTEKQNRIDKWKNNSIYNRYDKSRLSRTRYARRKWSAYWKLDRI